MAPIVAQTALQPEVAATSLPWLVTQCLAGWYWALHNATALPATPTSDVADAFYGRHNVHRITGYVIRRINAEEPYVRDAVTCRLFEACAFPHMCRREEINRTAYDRLRAGIIATRNTISVFRYRPI